MTTHRMWPAAAALVLGLGCQHGIPDPQVARRLDDVNGQFAYRASDGSGRLLLVGTVTLAVGADSILTGTWEIGWAPGADTTATVGPQIGTGTLSGRAGAEQSTINLNPGWADDNVFLLARPTDGDHLAGQWQHSTFVGPVAGGPFELRRLPG